MLGRAEHILLRDAAGRVREDDPIPKPPDFRGKTSCLAASSESWRLGDGSSREESTLWHLASKDSEGVDIAENGRVRQRWLSLGAAERRSRVVAIWERIRGERRRVK